MSRLTQLRLVALVGTLALGAGCTSIDADEADRRTLVLEEDNEGLRRQVSDMRSVNAARDNELEAKNRELRQLQQTKGSWDSERRRLESELAAQRNRTSQAEARASRAATRSPVAANGGASAARDRRNPSDRKISLPAIDDKRVEVVHNGDGTATLRVAGATMFPSGSADLTKEGRSILNLVSGALKRRSDLQISVEGHTDATPLRRTRKQWGTNRALSMARALSVEDYLKRVCKIKEGRMRVVGWGEHRPLVKGTTKEANARNRRVELVLSAGE